MAALCWLGTPSPARAQPGAATNAARETASDPAPESAPGGASAPKSAPGAAPAPASAPGRASAQGAASAPGGASTQGADPKPSDVPAPEAATPPLDTDVLARQHVRGCPVDGTGDDPADEPGCRQMRRELLREFESRTFPKPGSASPWMESERPAPTPHVTAPTASDPTMLRADLPWLAEIEAPDFRIHWHQRLIDYLVFYKEDPRGRNIMGAWLRDQGKYRDLILSHLRKAGLPEDLIYLSMIESSYDPLEYSRAGAAGLWQFMRRGAGVYGLRVDHWVDERYDPVRSTEAAMLYWADLYQRFGNWDLALAAYNGGYAAVLRSVAKYNTNDFWQLIGYENALPWGTSLYVPKALAAAIVGHNRKLFGYDDIKEAAPIEWDTVTVPKSVSLKIVARAAGVPVQEIEKLNPQLRRKRTPPREKDFPVRVPKGTAALFSSRFAALRAEWDRYDTYVISHGERFEDIATMHGISRAKLRELNGMQHESDATGGLAILVPRVSAADKARNLARAREDLYASGHPRGRPGEKLIVAVPDKRFQIKGKKRVFYRVVTGDTQYGIASAFGVDRFDLARWNQLDPEAHLHPRMILMVFVDPKRDLKARSIQLLDEDRLTVVNRGSKEHLDLVEERVGRKRVVYRATRRETFEQIAKKYGLTDYDLARINRLPRKSVLEKGDEIIVYKVVDPKRTDRAAEQARKARRHGHKKRPARREPAASPAKAPERAAAPPANEPKS